MSRHQSLQHGGKGRGGGRCNQVSVGEKVHLGHAAIRVAGYRLDGYGRTGRERRTWDGLVIDTVGF
jgi:hypothetical protein